MATETLDPAQAFITKIANRLKPVQEITARGTSNVQQFYCGATVFVTGGSGFLGKHLIEKLFRATKVSKVYVLLRCKKGKSVNQRLFEMLKDPLYDTLRAQQPEFVDKIVAVSGDVSELKLGLSGKDWNNIADEVDIILHLAATTRFDETLKTATFINVRGTRELLNIGKACKKLRSFVYVSTAFTHARADRVDQTISEKFYPSPISPETMIGIAETMDEAKIKNITSSLIKNWPNTYTYTKAVAESLVEAMGKGLPICVVRPAIVVTTIREPTPGWLDISCIYGATGLLLSVGLGALHATYVKEDNIMELVPVDFVNNAILVAAWETAKTKTSVPEENEIKIYTVTSSSRNALYWHMLDDVMSTDARNYATPKAIGYGFVWCTYNRLLFRLYAWLLHLIPAYIIDVVVTLFGHKRRYAKLAQKLIKMCDVLAYFLTHGWKFEDQNTASLYDKLSEDDKKIFNFDVTNIDWTEYILTWCVGLRKYIIKDGLTDTLYARKKQTILKIVTYTILPLYFYGIFKLLYCTIVFMYQIFV